MDKTVIKLKNLTKAYGELIAVNNISLEVNPGEVFGFLGPNGAGKTTTIRTLLNFIYPTSGEISVLGKDPTKLASELMQDIGYIAGDIAINESYKVKEFLNYLDKLHGQTSKLRDKLLKRFDLDENRKISDLSKGNKQKVAIVQAFMHTPRLLILDEPTSGLDPLLQIEFYKLIDEFKSHGTTIFFSSHILTEVQRVCDRVGIIKKGRLVSVESIKDLRKKNIYEIDILLSHKEDPKKVKIKNATDLDITDHSIKFTYKGKVNEMLKELSKYELLDISVNEPSLEKLFLNYYKDE